MDLNDEGERYCDDPRTEVAEHVPAGRLVLDVGCSRGAFGAELKRRDPERVVYGIEPTAAARHAEQRLDKVAHGFFPADLPVEWGPFDVVSFNDVLEHIEDPWTVLADTKSILRPGGTVVAALPNVRYIEVVMDLALRGEWRYQPSGVLDRTHLRFFTRRSIGEMFTGAGFTVGKLIPTHLDESKRRSARLLRRVGVEKWCTDLLAQRYLVLAQSASFQQPSHSPR
jgi:2-polyprenyl-3-methyl-5-hydroxy-6-metoxy-1,4-benzoquinol methylase